MKRGPGNQAPFFWHKNLVSWYNNLSQCKG